MRLNDFRGAPALLILLVCHALFGTSKVEALSELTAAFAEGELPGAWRTPAASARNTLLYLISAYQPLTPGLNPLAELESSGSTPESALELLQLSKRIHFPLTMRAIKPSELNEVPLPAIVHFDGSNPNEGTFHVLLSVHPDKVYYIDGGAVIVAGESRETFLRKWTGTIILPEKQHGSADYLTPVIGFACVLGGFISSIIIRHIADK